MSSQLSMFQPARGRPLSVEISDGLEEGRQRAREGMRRVARNSGEWREQAAEMIEGLARRLPDFTADEVREEVTRLGIGEPHHPNAYGAVMMAASKRGLIEKTMTVRPSTRPEAHGHCNPVWRSLVYRRPR